MTLDEAIKEIRELREWDEQCERQESANRTAIKRMHTLFTTDTIRAWAVVDLMISSVSNETNPPADHNAVRTGILALKGVNDDESG
jgi:hypothetical protein